MRIITCILMFCLCISGCATASKTNTPRSATEQLLLSQAVDRAMGDVFFDFCRGRKVYLDPSAMVCVDKEYCVASLQSVLVQAGARLSDAKDAEIIIVPRVGALGTDAEDFLLGLPSLPIVVPGAGAMETPEIALFKMDTQTAQAKIRLMVYNAKTKKHIATQSVYGDAYFRVYTILFIISLDTSDLPEKSWTHPRTVPIGSATEGFDPVRLTRTAAERVTEYEMETSTTDAENTEKAKTNSNDISP